MKKLLPLLLIIMAVLFASCSSSSDTGSGDSVEPTPNVEAETPDTEGEMDPADTGENPVAALPVPVRAVALNGPTGMGMAKFMSDADAGTLTDNDYTFTLAGAVDQVAPMIVKGEVDFAAVPANLAAVLYNNPDLDIQVAAIHTLGVLYIVENGETINSMADLSGKTIYASGLGATPEYSLNYLLEKHGITDVTIEWKTEHAEVVAALASTPNAIGMLPEPFVTTATTQNENLKVALSLEDEWNSVQDPENPAALVTGVLIVRTAFAEENPQAVEAFLSHYEKSIVYTNENPTEAATIIGSYGIVPETVAVNAIPNANIVFIVGDEMKTSLNGYLEVLFDANPASVGGAIPDDAFYYAK